MGPYRQVPIDATLKTPSALPAMTTTLPPGTGTCLKAEHYDSAAENAERIPWFEVHAENYMGDGGPAHWWLDRIRRDTPISIHGVGMSIGSAAGLDAEHLERLARVVERFEPSAISEHLAWSSHDHVFLNDLLPLPYTGEVLDRICRHVDQVQHRLDRTIMLENPSTYIRFRDNDYTETAFLDEISRRTGCALLLDVNNVHVSATNQGFSPADYIDRFPLDRVGEIHLAGHASETDTDGRPLLIDSHDREVSDPVWALFRHTLNRSGPLPTLIEWDAEIPPWKTLVHQAQLGDRLIASTLRAESHVLAG